MLRLCCVGRALVNMATRLVQHCLQGVPSTAQATIVAVLAEQMPSVRESLVTLVPSCLSSTGAAASPSVPAGLSVPLRPVCLLCYSCHVAMLTVCFCEDRGPAAMLTEPTAFTPADVANAADVGTGGAAARRQAIAALLPVAEVYLGALHATLAANTSREGPAVAVAEEDPVVAAFCGPLLAYMTAKTNSGAGKLMTGVRVFCRV